MGFRVSLNDTNGSHMQCLLTVALAPATPPSGTLHRLTKMQLRLAIYRGYQVQLLILYYQNRYFVLSNYDITGSNKFVPFSEFESYRI